MISCPFPSSDLHWLCHDTVSGAWPVGAVLPWRRGGFTGGPRAVQGARVAPQRPVTTTQMCLDTELYLRHLCVSNSSTGLYSCRCLRCLLSE